MPETPAEQESRIALERVYAALAEGRSFRLEAGAGAGKTYSLIKALEYLIKKHARDMPRRASSTVSVSLPVQRGQLPWVGNMWLPHSTHRLPMRCGVSLGHENTPLATGTCVVIVPHSRSGTSGQPSRSVVRPEG